MQYKKAMEKIKSKGVRRSNSVTKKSLSLDNLKGKKFVKHSEKNEPKGAEPDGDVDD